MGSDCIDCCAYFITNSRKIGTHDLDRYDLMVWFGILVAVNLQTAWLSPPVALSAYFLKGVVPTWDLKDIYLGMMQFMVIQLSGLI